MLEIRWASNSLENEQSNQWVVTTTDGVVTRGGGVEGVGVKFIYMSTVFVNETFFSVRGSYLTSLNLIAQKQRTKL